MPPEENASTDEESHNRGLRVVLPTSYATYVERWAIVVGISKYKHESLNLQYADRDAEALYELLLTPSGGRFEKDRVVKLLNFAASPGQMAMERATDNGEHYGAFTYGELRLATQQEPDNLAAHYYLGQALRALVEQEQELRS